MRACMNLQMQRHSARTFTCVFLLFVAFTVSAADDEVSKREKRITDTTRWLTNEFVPWLTNVFPDVPTKPWPDWFTSNPNPPSRTRFPTWITKGIPDFWNDVKKKVPVVPQAKTLPAITRGPYLQLGTTNSMVVRWRSEHPTPSEVAYGLSPDKLSKRESFRDVDR